MAFGSCFAENMGAKFQYYKFQSTTNPFGILFHPLAIEKVIHFALSEQKFTEKDTFFHNERWHCFDVHSLLSHPEKEVLLQKLNEAIQITRKQIKESTHFILTLGTAWVYKHKTSNEVVANCHKMPQNEFEKHLLSVSEIKESLQRIIEKIKEVNSNITFIFTISPVRHLKDGFVENQRSKAHIVAGLQNFLEEFSRKHPEDKSLEYFSAYEVMMDELRDYRFYADDLIHPNQLAIDLIWERFSETYFTEETFSTMKEVDSIQKATSHIPFNAEGEAHLRFLEALKLKIKDLQQRFSYMEFNK